MKKIFCLLLGHLWAAIPQSYQYWPAREGKKWFWARAECCRRVCLVCWEEAT